MMHDRITVGPPLLWRSGKAALRSGRQADLILYLGEGVWQWKGPGRGKQLVQRPESKASWAWKEASMVGAWWVRGEWGEVSCGGGRGRLTWQGLEGTDKDASFMLWDMGCPWRVLGIGAQSGCWGGKAWRGPMGKGRWDSAALYLYPPSSFLQWNYDMQEPSMK